MKKHLLFYLLPVLILASCSTPKYSYHFDHYNYQSGKKANVVEVPLEVDLLIDEHTLLASADNNVVIIHDKVDIENDNELPTSEDEIREIVKAKYHSMSKSEKKVFRKELKKEMKEFLKKEKDTSLGVVETSEMDRDLKLAIIFGAVGLTLSLFAGINAAFWVLGVIAIVVGVVFLIRWLVRQ
jgi:hypothetical protein